MSSKSYHQEGRERTRHIGFTRRLLNFTFSLPIVILLTIMFSIVVEWIGMNTIWKDQGVTHSHNMLIAEANYLNKHFAEAILGNNSLSIAKSAVNYMNTRLFIPLGIDDYRKKKNLRGIKLVVWEHVLAAYYIFNVVLIRLCVLVFSIPAYVLFAIVGLVTGLVERDLRRFGAGRESSDRFELSRKLIFPSVAVCFVLYLSCPFSLSPSLIVVPFAMLFGVAIHLTTSNYKKYL